MQTRLVALILTASIALLGGCDSDPDSEPTSGSATSSALPSGASEPVPALRLKAHFGTGSYCLNAGKLEDYLWSGTWLAAHEDATLTSVAPVTGGNLEIVGSWVVEDERDDGEFGPWSLASRRVKGNLVPLRGAELAGGAAYRVVLRLRPHRPLPSEVSGIAVDYTSGGQGDTVTDDSTLTVAVKC